MQRRALILGSQTLGLMGVHNDVAAIGPRLEARGFSLDVRINENASYEGMCEGLERLIADSTASDAAVIYYSGHGARVGNPRRGQPLPDGRLEPELFHALVPTNWSSTQFHGLLDMELSLYLARLTDKTQNVSIILDCCHSARMWKMLDDEPPTVRAVDRVEVPGVEVVVDELRKRDGSRLHAELNPHAVRLVACEADRSAYELRVPVTGGVVRMGLLTGKLIGLLDELESARISWRTLGMLLREQVMERIPIQRPEVEGAGQRYLFELATAERGGGVVYFLENGRQPALRTTRLLGAEVGAKYAIMPVGHDAYDAAATIADATITRISGACSHVDVQPRDASKPVPIGVMAFHVEGPLGRRGVRVVGEGAAADALRSSLQNSRYVNITTETDAAFMQAQVTGDSVVLQDVDDHPLSPSLSAAAALVRLECHARAAMLRDLGDGGLRARFELEWGHLVDGNRQPLSAGDTVYVGDKLYVGFENKDTRPLLFSVFDIGVDGVITLLTAASPMGTKLEPGRVYRLGLELGGTGMEVGWPDGVPADRPLPESLLVVVSTDSHDFTALETGRSTTGASTELERVFEQLGSGGGYKNLGAPRPAEGGEYCVQRIDFVASPQPSGKG